MYASSSYKKGIVIYILHGSLSRILTRDLPNSINPNYGRIIHAGVTRTHRVLCLSKTLKVMLAALTTKKFRVSTRYI